MTLTSPAVSGDVIEAVDEYDALEQLHAMGCTDGLPVVIPTPDRVERMVLASGFDGDINVGVMGPLGGSATITKIATCAVMAGCLPDYMPVVVAAVRAVVAPEFDSTEMQGTTHCLAPLIIVNGPARNDCGGVASGFGCFGPGHRANASIGRALRLTMMNIGGARPGVSDMALHGHPGKFTFCIAENEEDSPFTPLHTARGYDSSQSTVTVAGVEAPQSVIGVVEADDPDTGTRLLKSLGITLARLGGNNAHFGCGTGVVALNIDHANGLAAAGFNRESITEQIFEFATNRAGDLKDVAGLGKGTFDHMDDDKVLRAFRSPDDLVVCVAGGGGLYSMAMTSWGAGPHLNPAITVEIENNQFCAVPL